MHTCPLHVLNGSACLRGAESPAGAQLSDLLGCCSHHCFADIAGPQSHASRWSPNHREQTNRHVQTALFEDAQLCAIHAKRITLFVKGALARGAAGYRGLRLACLVGCDTKRVCMPLFCLRMSPCVCVCGGGECACSRPRAGVRSWRVVQGGAGTPLETSAAVVRGTPRADHGLPGLRACCPFPFHRQTSSWPGASGARSPCKVPAPPRPWLWARGLGGALMGGAPGGFGAPQSHQTGRAGHPGGGAACRVPCGGGGFDSSQMMNPRQRDGGGWLACVPLRRARASRAVECSYVGTDV